MARAKQIAIVTSAALFCAPFARATEPDAGDVACLASVLRSAPNAISVAPAKDIEQRIYYSSNIAHDKFVRVPTVARGVDYTFRKPDGATTTVGVYLATQTTIEFPGECARDPHCVETAMSAIVVPSDNGRFQILLRQDYPPGGYPWSKPAYADSPEHPLFALWSALARRCKADNPISSGITP